MPEKEGKKVSVDDELRAEPQYSAWFKEMKAERTWEDKDAHKQLLALYKMFKGIAKDRKANKAEKKAAAKAGKDASTIDVGGKGNNLIVKEEFVKSLSKKAKVYDAESKKMQPVIVANPELLFDQMEKTKGRSDGIMNADEFMKMMFMLRSPKPEVKLELAFIMFDVDKSGSLTRQEILMMLLAIVAKEGADMAQVEAELNAPPMELPDGKVKRSLLDEILFRADGEMTKDGDQQQMQQDGKGDGKITLKELQSVLAHAGWLTAYLGEPVSRDQLVNKAVAGKSSACLVM